MRISAKNIKEKTNRETKRRHETIAICNGHIAGAHKYDDNTRVCVWHIIY